MKNFEQFFYAGIGLALKGKEKVEAYAKNFAKNNKMEAAAGKKFVDEAIKQAEAAKKDFKKKLDESIKTAIDSMGLVTKKDAAALKAEIAKLKAELAKSRKTAKKK